MTKDIQHLKWIAALMILAMTWIAGWYPFKKKLTDPKKHEFPIGEAISCGVFLGAGLIHMLGDASQDFSAAHWNYPMAPLLCGITFLLLLWLEHMGRELYEHQGASSNAFAILAVAMLAIHSFLAGAALGLSSSLSVFMVILLAILAHKWAASFSLAIQINKSELSFKQGIIAFAVFSIMAPLGIFVGSMTLSSVPNMHMLEPIFSSLAAGTFLYLGTLHGLNRAVMVDKCCNIKQYSFVIAGFLLMAIVAIWT